MWKAWIYILVFESLAMKEDNYKAEGCKATPTQQGSHSIDGRDLTKAGS